MSTVAEIKEAVTRLPARQKIQIARWMQTQISGHLRDHEMMAIAAEGGSSLERRELEEAMRHSLRSPLKKYRSGHFAALASRNNRRKSVR